MTFTTSCKQHSSRIALLYSGRSGGVAVGVCVVVRIDCVWSWWVKLQSCACVDTLATPTSCHTQCSGFKLCYTNCVWILPRCYTNCVSRSQEWSLKYECALHLEFWSLCNLFIDVWVLQNSLGSDPEKNALEIENVNEWGHIQNGHFAEWD